MSVKSGDKQSVSLHPLDLTMEQSREMTLFDITNYRLVNVNGSRKGIQMTIKMKRKILSEMMTTYFPSFLLMMITYATTFFKPFFFEAALSVNLTTMLVMTTIFISKMEGLPPTSATKMIDYWLILCQLVPFIQVVLLTAKEYLREEKPEEDQHLEKQKVKVKKDEKPLTAWAWTISQIEYSRAFSLTVLTMIGEYFFKIYIFYSEIFTERKMMPLIVLFASVVYFAIAAYFFHK